MEQLQRGVDACAARFNRFKEHLAKESKVRIEDSDPDEVIITIPRVDFSKGVGGPIAAVVICGWFLILPAILFVHMVDLDEVLAEYGVSGIHWKAAAFIVVMVPWYCVLNVCTTMLKDMFRGFQEIRINMLTRIVTYYDSLAFAVLGIPLGGPTKVQGPIENTRAELKPPFKFLGMTLRERYVLYLTIDDRRFRMGERRSDAELKKVHRAIKSSGVKPQDKK